MRVKKIYGSNKKLTKETQPYRGNYDSADYME